MPNENILVIFLGALNVITRGAAIILEIWLCLGVGFRAAGTFVRERQLKTLDNLLTLPVDRREILHAKWLGSILRFRGEIICLAVVLLGGVITASLHVLALLLLLLAVTIHVVFLASLGLFLSVLARTRQWAFLALGAFVFFLVSLSWFPHLYGFDPLYEAWDEEAAQVVGRWSGNWWSRVSQNLNPLTTWWYLGFSWDQSISGILSNQRLIDIIQGLALYLIAAGLLWAGTLARFRWELHGRRQGFPRPSGE